MLFAKREAASRHRSWRGRVLQPQNSLHLKERQKIAPVDQPQQALIVNNKQGQGMELVQIELRQDR
jgi:hypothetical protein